MKASLVFPFTCLIYALFAFVAHPAHSAPVELVQQEPVEVRRVEPDVLLIDFGRVCFGNLRLLPPAEASGEIVVHFGEMMTDGRINRQPPGSVRYASTRVELDGAGPLVAAPPADARNTKQPAAVLTPAKWGVVLPFRWVEIEGWPGELRPGHLRRQAAFASTWDDEAAAFDSSDELLNQIWELCRYSIKATTFAGVYVDGDRERIPYEIDAHLAQLSHYACDPDPQIARDTFDWLMRRPTWPTECSLHMVFIAHADWMQTGDTGWVGARYEGLKSKLLLERAREDGLLVSNDKQVRSNDIVDWPKSENDGFVYRPVNTVVNAFHLRALAMMAELAAALGIEADAAEYAERERMARAAFQEKLFDPAQGVYRDGEGADHSSQHANFFPLAFGLVPPEHRARLVEWIGRREMACSVYGAQYLLTGLFEHGGAAKALELITAPTDRSWRHMIESGTTITWEAWDQRYKPNQDWNHAWGAAPANLLPRYVLGVQPLAPGWRRAAVRPNPGTLKYANGKVPTSQGPVFIGWENGPAFKLSLTLPPGMSAQVQLPAAESSSGVYIDGQPVGANRSGGWWVLADDVRGTVALEVR